MAAASGWLRAPVPAQFLPLTCRQTDLNRAAMPDRRVFIVDDESAIGGVYAFGFFCLLFLPLIWIATRHGLAAASWAVLAVQAGLIAGLAIQDQSDAMLRAFQLLMFAL